MIEKVYDNLDFGFLFTVIGALLGLFALIQAWRYKTRKEFSLLSWDNENLLKKQDLKVDNLRLLFNDKEVDQVNVIRLYFQNEGNSVVRKEDIHTDNFKISLDNPIEILSINFYSTNTHNKIDWLQASDTEILFSVDFIEPDDIIKIEIQYSNADKVGGKIIGKVIGGNAFERKFEDNSFKYQSYSSSKYSNDLNLVLMIFIFTLGLEFFILRKFLNIESTFGLLNEMTVKYKALDFSVNLLSLTFIFIFLLVPAYLMARLTAWAVKPYWLKMKDVKNWTKK